MSEIKNFTREHDLRDTVFALPLTDRHSTTLTMVRREVPMGGVRPDLVYVSFAQQPIESLWPRNWTYRHAHIVSILRSHRKLRLSTLAKRCYDQPERVSPLISDIESTGAVKRSPTGAYYLSEAMLAVDAQVLAVETKLLRWRNALEQATEYRRFADGSVVAMAPTFAPRDGDYLNYFKSNGIGLLTIADGTIEWFVAPRFSKARGAEKEYLVGSAARSHQTLWSALY